MLSNKVMPLFLESVNTSDLCVLVNTGVPLTVCFVHRSSDVCEFYQGQAVPPGEHTGQHSATH